jgi:hypothetical protein
MKWIVCWTNRRIFVCNHSSVSQWEKLESNIEISHLNKILKYWWT